METVVRGMSQSTPESKAMIGIFLAWACWSSGIAPCCPGRRCRAPGILAQGGLDHLDLLVDLGLGLGAFEGDLDVKVLGGLLGALLHRLPELVLEALGDQGDVGFRFGRLLRTRRVAAGMRGRGRACRQHQDMHSATEQSTSS